MVGVDARQERAQTAGLRTDLRLVFACALGRRSVSRHSPDAPIAAQARGYNPRVPYIRTVPPEEATGLLRKLFDEAVRRAGKVFNVLRIQSVRPHVLDATVKLYAEVMHSPRGPLSRVQREMVATVVSRVNQCHY